MRYYAGFSQIGSHLTYQEEQELVSLLLNCAKLEYGRTRKDVLNIVHAIPVRKAEEDSRQFSKDCISQGW